MFDNDVAFNRFSNLDSIEDRLVNYLIQSDSIHANRIWKLLKYGTKESLMNNNLTSSEKSKLIDTGASDQSEFRIFKQPFMEDAFTVECSMLKFYIDSVVPINHLLATVNIGIDIMTHNKIQLVYNDSFDEVENPEQYRPIEQNIITKNRNTLLLKCLLAELNGKFIEGVGQLQFNQQTSMFSQARLGLFNNKNYCGYKVLFACNMSGVSANGC